VASGTRYLWRLSNHLKVVQCLGVTCVMFEGFLYPFSFARTSALIMDHRTTSTSEAKLTYCYKFFISLYLLTDF